MSDSETSDSEGTLERVYTWWFVCRISKSKNIVVQNAKFIYCNSKTMKDCAMKTAEFPITKGVEILSDDKRQKAHILAACETFDLANHEMDDLKERERKAHEALHLVASQEELNLNANSSMDSADLSNSSIITVVSADEFATLKADHEQLKVNYNLLRAEFIEFKKTQEEMNLAIVNEQKDFKAQMSFEMRKFDNPLVLAEATQEGDTLLEGQWTCKISYLNDAIHDTSKSFMTNLLEEVFGEDLLGQFENWNQVPADLQRALQKVAKNYSSAKKLYTSDRTTDYEALAMQKIKKLFTNNRSNRISREQRILAKSLSSGTKRPLEK